MWRESGEWFRSTQIHSMHPIRCDFRRRRRPAAHRISPPSPIWRSTFEAIGKEKELVHPTLSALSKLQRNPQLRSRLIRISALSAFSSP